MNKKYIKGILLLASLILIFFLGMNYIKVNDLYKEFNVTIKYLDKNNGNFLIDNDYKIESYQRKTIVKSKDLGLREMIITMNISSKKQTKLNILNWYIAGSNGSTNRFLEENIFVNNKKRNQLVKGMNKVVLKIIIPSDFPIDEVPETIVLQKESQQRFILLVAKKEHKL